MKKSIFISTFLFSAWTSSHAVVSLSWNTIADTVKQSDGTTAAPATWVAQLIWTPTAVADPVSSVTPLVPTGDDQLVYSQALNTIPFAGFIVGEAPGSSNLSDGRAGGFVYTRVFNVNFGSPSVPTLYGQSNNFGGRQGSNGSIALTITTNDPSTSNDHAPTGIVVNQQIVAIPEPSTYALAAVGIAAALWRRRRKA